jgi:hypothetical protein
VHASRAEEQKAKQEGQQGESGWACAANLTPRETAVQNKRAPRYCDAPLLHWSGSPSIHGALP